MPAADVTIPNRSLSLIGVEEISSLTDDTESAKACNRHYERVVVGLLSKHPWRFAMRKVQLTQETAPTNEWRYAYTMPSNMIGEVVAVFDSAAVGARPINRFEVFGRAIYADAAKVYIDHRIRVAEALWPPWFGDLAMHHLASLIAEELTDDSEKARTQWQIAYGSPQENNQGGLFQEARKLNAMQQPPMAVEDFSLIGARFGGMP